MCTLGRSVEQICSWIFHGGSSEYRDFFLRACRRAVSERKKNASQNARAGRNGARRDGNRRDHRGAESRGVPQKVQFDTKSTLLRLENNPAENNTRFHSNFCRIASVFLPRWLSSRECISPLDVVSSNVSDRASGFLFVHLMDNTRINKGPCRCFRCSRGG